MVTYDQQVLPILKREWQAIGNRSGDNGLTHCEILAELPSVALMHCWRVKNERRFTVSSTFAAILNAAISDCRNGCPSIAERSASRKKVAPSFLYINITTENLRTFSITIFFDEAELNYKVSRFNV